MNIAFSKEPARRAFSLPVLRLGLLLAAGGLLAWLYLAPPEGRESFPLDDAWIHLVYARNLAEGHGFSYNPPEQEAGFTSPLWVLCLAPEEAAAGGAVPAKLVSLAGLLLLAWGAARLAGPAAALLVLFDPLLQFSAFSGMEVCLFAFLALFALERVLQECFPAAGLFAALAILTRPEGLVVWGIVLVFGLLPSARAPVPAGVRLRRAAALAVPALLAAGLWSAFCIHVTGRPLPNTFYAKLFLPSTPEAPGPVQGLLRLVADEGSLFPLLLLLPSAAAFLLPGRRRAALALLLFFVLLSAGVFATRPVVRVEAFYWERYLVPGLAGLHALLGLGLRKTWRLGRAGRLAALLFLGALLAAQGLHMPEKRGLYLRNCRDIALLDLAAARWIAKNTPPDAVVAVLDAGAARYFGNRRIVDLAGLNDKRLTRPRDLPAGVDSGDAAVLAAYSGAGWLILPEQHFSGRGGFEPVHVLRIDDLSLYVIPRAETLLILKKVRF